MVDRTPVMASVVMRPEEAVFLLNALTLVRQAGASDLNDEELRILRSKLMIAAKEGGVLRKMKEKANARPGA